MLAEAATQLTNMLNCSGSIGNTEHEICEIHIVNLCKNNNLRVCKMLRYFLFLITSGILRDTFFIILSFV